MSPTIGDLLERKRLLAGCPRGYVAEDLLDKVEAVWLRRKAEHAAPHHFLPKFIAKDAEPVKRTNRKRAPRPPSKDAVAWAIDVLCALDRITR